MHTFLTILGNDELLIRLLLCSLTVQLLSHLVEATLSVTETN